MSDTFFSGAPHWTWFIIPYFFVGGLAGGAYFLAAVLDWFGRPRTARWFARGTTSPPSAPSSRPAAHDRPGSPVTLLAHAVPVGEFPRPHVQGLVAISFGAWAILLFGLFSVLSALGRGPKRGGSRCGAPRRRRRGEGWSRQACRGRRRLARALRRRLHGDPFIGHEPAHLGGQPWLGALFVASGVSTGAAALILRSRVAAQRSARSGGCRRSTPKRSWSSCSCSPPSFGRSARSTECGSASGDCSCSSAWSGSGSLRRCGCTRSPRRRPSSCCWAASAAARDDTRLGRDRPLPRDGGAIA